MDITFNTILSRYKVSEEYNNADTKTEKQKILKDKVVEQITTEQKKPCCLAIILLALAVAALVGAFFTFLFLSPLNPLFMLIPIGLVAGSVLPLGFSCKYFYELAQIQKINEIVQDKIKELEPKPAEPPPKTADSATIRRK